MQAIERAFTVLRVLAGGSGTSTLAEVARSSGLPKSTVLRLLNALHDQGAVQIVGGRYAIGPGLSALTDHGAPVSALKEIARPHLVDLADLLEENVALTIADGDATLYVDTALAESSVMVTDWTGERLPYHASAGGLALMSTWTAADRRRLVEAGLEPFTSSTVVTAAGLQAKMTAMADDGVVWTTQEYSEDVNGVAALITTAGGRVVGALNAYGPDYRFPGERAVDEITGPLLETCRHIGERLG